jgi:hemoglobin-like flavoprotein
MPVSRHPLAFVPLGTQVPLDADVPRILRESLKQFVPLGVTLTHLFYHALFDQYPSLRRMFPLDLAPLERKLFDTLQLVVDSLDRPEEIYPQLATLGARHAQYGAVPEHYTVVCTVLITTMRSIALEHNLKWTPEAEHHWHTTLALISQRMIAGEPSSVPSVSVAPTSTSSMKSRQ